MFRQILSNRPRVENALLQLDKNWAKLPALQPELLFDGFNTRQVVLTELPLGPWSSPLADVALLAKLVACREPTRLLEVGSYRGFTTKLLAEHAPIGATVVAIDIDPQHGEAYRDVPVADKIERRVGTTEYGSFSTDEHGSFDFIFIDADHSYQAVKKDTEFLLPMLASAGLMVWHDYGNWGRISGLNGVPRYLHELAEKRAVAYLPGTQLAIYSPGWEPGAADVDRFRSATNPDVSSSNLDAWNTTTIRG